MSNNVTVIIIILCIILCIYFITFYSYKTYNIDSKLSHNHAQIYKKFGYYPSKSHNYDVFIPSQFDDAEVEIDKYIQSVNHNKHKKYINGIYNMDYLASKRNFYVFLKMIYTDEILNELIPKTIMPKDLDKLNLDKNKIYILKRDDLQQQKGLVLSNNKNHMMELINNTTYAVIQEFLQNPFIIQDYDYTNNTITNRKINLRIYTFVIIKNGVLKVFVYKDGFLYYTPDEFKYSLNPSNMITTGYIDRSVYARNPLTLSDFKTYVNLKGYNYDMFWELLKFKFAIIFEVYRRLWKINNSEFIHYQIFGADVEPNGNLTDLKILEFNKGPDLDAKDERDKQLKENMFKDSLKLLFNNDSNVNFDEINFFTEL